MFKIVNDLKFKIIIDKYMISVTLGALTFGSRIVGGSVMQVMARLALEVQISRGPCRLL